jgi:hypothetical protein
MARKWDKVSSEYFGQPLGNQQDPDEPYDQSPVSASNRHKLNARGAMGGGSQITPQARRSGSGASQGSFPRHSQKLRG